MRTRESQASSQVQGATRLDGMNQNACLTGSAGRKLPVPQPRIDNCAESRTFSVRISRSRVNFTFGDHLIPF